MTQLTRHRITVKRRAKLRDLFLQIGVPLSSFKGTKPSDWLKDNRHQLEYLLHDARQMHRARILACHPDRGGDAHEAAELNNIMDQIEERVALVIDPAATHKLWTEVNQRRQNLAVERPTGPMVTIRCAVCGNAAEVVKTRCSQRVTCGDKCAREMIARKNRGRARQSRVVIVCKVCGDKKEVAYKFRNQKTCGDKCAADLRARGRRKPDLMKPCGECGLDFPVPVRRRAHKYQYCGKFCRDKAKRKRALRRWVSEGITRGFLSVEQAEQFNGLRAA